MRNLRLTTPYAKGSDVLNLQRALNVFVAKHPRLGLTKVGLDAQYGPNTAHLTAQVVFFLGIGNKPSESVKPWVQRRVINPRLRGPIQRVRQRQRLRDFHRIPHGIAAVIAWEKTKLGVRESPMNSNRGPEISKWQRDVAGIDAQPWCGAFQGFALKHIGGLPITAGIVYTPNIIHYAKTGTAGFASWHSWADRKPGDLVLFKWPGVSSAPCDHVGIVIDPAGHTIEGNTSSGNNGSQNNGGGVYLRDRGGANVVGCARPRW